MTRTHLSTAIALALLSATGSAFAVPTSTEMVAMRDGVRLATDVYLPITGTGPWPIVLYRIPYGKSGFDSLGTALRDYGVATVAQDMRGRFDSEGVDCVFLCDGDGSLQDGFDTVAWIRSQTWSNDKIVSFGSSAGGIVQYLNATAAPEGLQALWAGAATSNLYDDMVFHGGVFHQNMVEGWLEGQGSSAFLTLIAAHPLEDDFWLPGQTRDRYNKVNAAGVHLGGWFDIFTQGTIDAFVGYQHQGGTGANGKQKLVIGPWTHGGFMQVAQGELTFPSQSTDYPSGNDQTLGDFLAYYLGLSTSSTSVDQIPPVQYYVMGAIGEPSAPGNEWRTAQDWPIPAAAVRTYLQSDGTLAEQCPTADAAPVTYTYDPANPTPTIGGGNLLLPAGPMDQRTVEQRSDVVLFSTPVLAEPVEITGRIKAHLWVSIDTPDTDLMVRLTDVYPDGRSMLLTDGALRLALRNSRKTLELLSPGQVVEAEVDLWSTSIIVAQGHQIRISISSSNAPRFWPNPNDGTSYGGTPTPRPVQVTLHRSADYPSYLELSMPQRPESSIVVCGAVADAGADQHADSHTAQDATGDSVSHDASTSTPDGRIESGADHETEDGGSDSTRLSPGGDDDGGCSCELSRTTRGDTEAAWLLVGLAGMVWRKRRPSRHL